MITRNSVVKIKNPVVIHESRPVNSNPVWIQDIFQTVSAWLNSAGSRQDPSMVGTIFSMQILHTEMEKAPPSQGFPQVVRTLRKFDGEGS